VRTGIAVSQSGYERWKENRNVQLNGITSRGERKRRSSCGCLAATAFRRQPHVMGRWRRDLRGTFLTRFRRRQQVAKVSRKHARPLGPASQISGGISSSRWGWMLTPPAQAVEPDQGSSMPTGARIMASPRSLAIQANQVHTLSSPASSWGALPPAFDPHRS
jgi:hypothetical protein